MWTISPPPDMVVSLKFIEFNTEFNNDFVHVLDGNCTLATLSGSEGLKETYNSSVGNDLTLWLVSDTYINGMGFKANYFAAPSPPSSSVVMPTHSEEEAALTALYNATQGPEKWTVKWNHHCSTCKQLGVSCNSAGHVTALSLIQNSLIGPIPSQIGNLTWLTRLNLGFNCLKGTIPTSIHTLTLLTYLGLHSNQLTGTIPEAVGNLKSILEMWLDINSLSGSLPSSIGNLTTVTQMGFHQNKLTGSIPSLFGLLNSLTTLMLFTNSFSGKIPREIGRLPFRSMRPRVYLLTVPFLAGCP